ncbi:Cytochrome c553 [Moraxella cuniculi DSM 21768]|uniref:Cytochrome c553 n=2 Tax=Moraxella cuniculi TaxID=34061 RepID=A0A1N7D906_9GAMM|nr:c-type cytochrome [Moraxella cuniculi]OOS07910.1 cytochrome C [Moraxella cuniculi]SIR72215.1 Cytochrome c553 [Moraxella cuniculi DSM 21768]VEG13016.1 Cytochrome c4 precursor [Moraxella cuniculi]
MKPAKKATLAKFALASSIGIASLSAYAASYPVPAYNIEAGKAIVENNCAACHGANGVSVAPLQPNLGGQNIKYLYKQLVDFKTKARRNGVMEAQLVGLTQQDLADVAGYYASQAPWTPGYGNKATAAEATKLYLGGDKTRGVIPCAGCHDPKGSGNAFAAFPRLGGQHASYLALQLKLFRAAGREDEVATDMEVRTNDAAKKGEKGMMQMVAARLSDRDIKILSEYLSAVH